MALVTQFSVKTISGCTKFYLKDTTPAWDAVSAPTGYDSTGVNNPNPSSITSINVAITNMADPTVTRTVIIPTTSPTFTPATIPGIVKYTISSYQTALSASYTISSSNSNAGAGSVTYTTSVSHPYTVGQTVTVTGASNALHNVTGIVTATPAVNVFTLSIPTIASNTTSTGGSSLGYTNTAFTVTDGVYKFVYNILLSGVTYTATCYIVVDCTVSDTLTSMLKDLNCCNNCSDANNTKLNLLYQAYLLREKACYLATCQDFTGAQEVLDCLNAMIGTTSCDSCS